MSSIPNSLLGQIVEPWYESLRNPRETQERALKTLLAGYSKTDYGARFGASSIGGIEEFRSRFPTASYADLSAQRTIPSGRLIPMSLSTSTGSVSLSMALPSGVAASLRASTGTGSLTRDLPGFSISQDTRGSLLAATGDPGSASQSFTMTASAGTGSVDLVVASG